MGKPKPISRLQSASFVSLYLASIGAIVLLLGHNRWSKYGWYPVCIGVVASLAIIPVINLLAEMLEDTSKGTLAKGVLFLLSGIIQFAGIFFLERRDWLLICGLSCISAFSFYAAFGTIFQWPGFRKPKDPDICESCGWELTENDSDNCTECGASISRQKNI